MDQQLQDDWARANRGGRAALRQKAFATVASVAVTAVILFLGYFVVLGLFDRVRVVHLVLPWFPALPAGWWVRGKLWPRGALGR
jgi:hypothetical protein